MARFVSFRRGATTSLTGQITDFYRAVQAEPDETVVFAFIEWPSKQASTEAWDKIMKDERMQPSGDAPVRWQTHVLGRL